MYEIKRLIVQRCYHLMVSTEELMGIRPVNPTVGIETWDLGIRSTHLLHSRHLRFALLGLLFHLQTSPAHPSSDHHQWLTLEMPINQPLYSLSLLTDVFVKSFYLP